MSQISALNDYKENIDYAVSIINSTQQNQKRYKGIFTYHPEGLGRAIAGFLVTSEPMSIHTKTNEDGTGTTVSGGGTERKAFGQLRVSLIDIASEKTMWIGDAAAPTSMPDKLIEQLAPQGRIIIPVGSSVFDQSLYIITKNKKGAVKIKRSLPVRFVPMVG